MPVVNAGLLDLWLCDEPVVYIYLVAEGSGFGAYYELDNTLYYVSPFDELKMVFEDTTRSNVYIVPPAGYEVLNQLNGVEGGVYWNTNILTGEVYHRIDDDLDTYEFAADEIAPGPKAPSLGKITIKSRDTCPPPKDN